MMKVVVAKQFFDYFSPHLPDCSDLYMVLASAPSSVGTQTALAVAVQNKTLRYSTSTKLSQKKDDHDVECTMEYTNTSHDRVRMTCRRTSEWHTSQSPSLCRNTKNERRTTKHHSASIHDEDNPNEADGRLISCQAGRVGYKKRMQAWWLRRFHVVRRSFTVDFGELAPDTELLPGPPCHKHSRKTFVSIADPSNDRR